MSNVSLSRKPLDVMTPTDPAPLKKEKSGGLGHT